MPVANFSRYAELSPETARQIMGHIMAQVGQKPPEGAIFHAEGPSDDGGWWTFDVWESDDAAQQFMDNVVNPILSSLNIQVTEDQRLPVVWESNHPERRP